MSDETQKPKAWDIIVETPNPAGLDLILQSFGAAVVQDGLERGTYLRRDGGYVVRCFSDPDFIKFVVTNQGYGKFIKRLDALV